jgi:predicted nucleic acid-binding protein
MSSFNVVLDACVIFPAPLRDTLFRAAKAGLYRMYITDDILEEVRRNLINKRNLTEDKAQKLISVIREQFPESFVTGYSRLIASMENDIKDRHVLAAAVRCNAQVIVTMNLKDFPAESLATFDIEAQSPDEFLLHLFHLAPDTMAQLIIEQAEDLHNPSMTAPELLANHIRLHAPEFVKLVQAILMVEETTYSWVKTNTSGNH